MEAFLVATTWKTFRVPRTAFERIIGETWADDLSGYKVLKERRRGFITIYCARPVIACNEPEVGAFTAFPREKGKRKDRRRERKTRKRMKPRARAGVRCFAARRAILFRLPVRGTSPLIRDS